MLKQRIQVGVLLGVALLCLVWLAPLPLLALVLGLLVLAGSAEWATLAAWSGLQRGLYVSASALLLLLCYLLLADAAGGWLLLAASLWWLGVPLLLSGKGRWLLPGSGWQRALLGWLLLPSAWLGLLFLRQGFAEVDGRLLLGYLLLLVSVMDCAAYGVGRCWGRHRLAPHISPGKTWEGLGGGSVAAVLCAVSGMFLLGVPGPAWLPFLLLSLFVCALGVVGDLYISLLKRQAGRKDSGRLLPGHGGMLDRIDSLCAAAPPFAVGLWLVEAWI